MTTSTPSIAALGPQPATDLAGLRVAAPTTLVIFGATGDLTARKLLPALAELHARDFLPAQFSVVGVARRPLTDDAFRAQVGAAIAARGDPAASKWQNLAPRVHYQPVTFDDTKAYSGLAARLDQIEQQRGQAGQRLYYLAVGPEHFLPIIHQLDAAGLIHGLDEPCPCKVIIEKPFGSDLRSARELNAGITRILREDQIYRIDHYLGKETVLNILSFRFGNAVFEPLFNSQHVDHVQITVAESIGMEGRRGAFYEQAGALRDVVQNHGLQLLALAAMEPPAVLTSKGMRDEKVKVLQCLRRMRPEEVAGHVVRGQYAAGSVGGQAAAAYRQEAGVDPQSNVETYAALRIHVDNWRWAGVPFFLRAGKRLAARATEIAVQFKQPPLHFFTTVECVGDVCDIRGARPNLLIFRIQPDEGISLTFSAKRPGMLFQIHPVQMDFLYNRSFDLALPEAYERLLLDAMRGDSTLFMRSDEVEAAWSFVQPILEAWADPRAAPPESYAAGTWGPTAAGDLPGPQRAWRHPQGDPGVAPASRR